MLYPGMMAAEAAAQWQKTRMGRWLELKRLDMKEVPCLNGGKFLPINGRSNTRLFSLINQLSLKISVLVRSLKSSILSSTSLQMDKTFWGVVSAAVEQSRRKASMVARGDGEFGWPQYLSKPNQTKTIMLIRIPLMLMKLNFLSENVSLH